MWLLSTLHKAAAETINDTLDAWNDDDDSSNDRAAAAAKEAPTSTAAAVIEDTDEFECVFERFNGLRALRDLRTLSNELQTTTIRLSEHDENVFRVIRDCILNQDDPPPSPPPSSTTTTTTTESFIERIQLDREINEAKMEYESTIQQFRSMMTDSSDDGLTDECVRFAVRGVRSAFTRRLGMLSANTTITLLQLARYITIGGDSTTVDVYSEVRAFVQFSRTLQSQCQQTMTADAVNAVNRISNDDDEQQQQEEDEHMMYTDVGRFQVRWREIASYFITIYQSIAVTRHASLTQ